MDSWTDQHITFEWKGRTGPFDLVRTPAVFEPTQLTKVLAEALDINPGDTVIDVGCGCGVLALVAARLGAGRVYGCDLSEEAVQVATQNAERLGLSDVCEFRTGDLFQPVADVRADVVIGDVSGIPDAVAEVTGWFGGGPTGAELPVAMLESVGECIRPGGRMYLPTGSIQAEQTIVDAANRIFGGEHVEVIRETRLLLSAKALLDAAVAKLISDHVIRVVQDRSRVWWNLAIRRCVRAV